MLRFHIITLFHESFSYLDHSIIGRAREAKKIAVSFWNPRDFTSDAHRTADDKAYGGGPGMVMKAEPVLKAADKAVGRKKKNVTALFFTPNGIPFTNDLARELAQNALHILLISGHYEGVDERVVLALGDRGIHVEKVSIGPYILSGGEVPAMAVVDAVARQIPGVLGKSESLEESRVASSETYTRPESFSYKGKTYNVPDVLLSGNHKRIEEWRKGKINF